MACLPLRIFGLIMLLAGCSPGALATAPNVLVILVDDLGIGDLSAYGGSDLQTPHMDQLLSSGVKFDNFYANCPVCSPTRAALLTGKYQERVGVPGVIRTRPEDSWGNLSDDAVLLPALLGPAGYHTAIIGKWHLGLEKPDRPNDRGFDFFKGFLGDMMDDYTTHLRHGINYMRENETEIQPTGHATDLFTQWSIDYLRARQNTQAPWFLYLAYNAPHTPIQPPADWLEKIQKREPTMAPRRAKIVALIEHLDEGIGRVMDALQATGQAKNTLVIFTSDNGGQLGAGGTNGPWRGGKEETYEGGIRVAGGACWPGVIRPGRTASDRLLSMDIFPTVLDVAGVNRPADLDGHSFAGLFRDEAFRMPDRNLFFSRREGNARYMGECIWALRQGDWKLVKNSPMQPWELYNVQEDPGETSDLFKKEKARAQSMSELMRQHIQRGGQIPWQ